MEQLKKLVCEIMDMNGGEFAYSPSVSFYGHREPILSVFVKDTTTDVVKHVQPYNEKEIIEILHDTTAKMLEQREESKEARVKELEEQLKKLKGDLS